MHCTCFLILHFDLVSLIRQIVLFKQFKVVKNSSIEKDIEKKVIRHVCDATFGEDPLRVFRAAQFASRFDFTLAEETKSICKTMKVSTLSYERVFEELLPEYVKPLLFNETYHRSLEHYVKKLHAQFLNKPLISASIVLSRNNWFVRKNMEMLICIGSLFDRCFYRRNHHIKYSDDKYDAMHPEKFTFNNPL